MPQILLIEDDQCFADSIKMLVKPAGFRVQWATDAAKGYQLFSQTEDPFDTVIIDYHLPDLKGAELAEILRRKNPSQQIIFATGDQTHSTMSTLLKTGAAAGFISKGDAPEEMLSVIEKSVQNFRRNKRILKAPSSSDITEKERLLSSIGLIGRSDAMYEIYEKVQRLKNIDTDVLILGETGTGKEIVAKAILNPGQKLFAINCAEFSESTQLMESELFGHAKGSFTDAKMDKPGIFEIANGGIIFLDEIHALSKAAQGKLLRVLQERKIRRLGETFERDLKGKLKIVFATKPTILKSVDSGDFLPDLFYRINKARISIPPLRDRIEDLEPLVAHFSLLYGKKFNLRKHFESSVLKEMETYKWPGNVRELENMVSSWA